MKINDYIKSLSIKDKKTLSQKGLKLTEEVGELAKAILPYDSAHGTNHRFIDKEKILEEVVDVYLTNISIAHSLGITDEEFNDMLIKKSEKWNELQSREEKAEFPLPFEIHITVEVSGDNFDPENMDGSLEYFKQCCKTIGVKPIVLDLEINGESSMKDIMTSSKYFGDNRSAYEESERIGDGLVEMGYKVIRKKIETVPWHPGAPVISTGKDIPNGCYFESHIGVIIKPDDKNRLNDFVSDVLNNSSIVQLWGTVKLSQNFFKKSKNGDKFVNMLTYRCNRIGAPTFKIQVEAIKELLKDYHFEFEKVEVEYAIYDTNVTHDAKWITG